MEKRIGSSAGNNHLIQQGDVLLFSGATVPAGSTRRPHTRLAEGEVTGHCHEAVGDGVELVERAGVLYLVAPHGGEVTHQEHATVEIPAGTYRVERVKEYDHFAEEARQVED